MTKTSPLPAQDGGENAPLSAAHEASRKFVIDPAFDAGALCPAPDLKLESAPWIYGDAQREAWEVEQLVSEGFAANRHVHYARNYGRVAPVVTFRHAWPDSAPETLTFRSNGNVTIRAGGVVIFDGPKKDEAWTMSLPKQAGEMIEIDVKPEGGEPAALLIESGPLRTGGAWQCSADAKTWAAPSAWPQSKSGRLPHELEEPVVLLRPVSAHDGVYDFGVTILGRPVFRCDGTPAIFTGESAEEACAPAEKSESHLDVEQLPDGRWTSRHALGFRYLRIEGGKPDGVAAGASYHPVRYGGAFACSDEQLTRIWMNSAFTLRTCMQRLMLDGVKRDRMPWVGDLASNLIVNAYTFAEPDIIRRSLTALGRPTGGYMNGIVDYSLWWVINMVQYQRYFDDVDYLMKELPHVDALLERMAGESDGDGLLRPAAGAWVFIDWGMKNDATKTLTALQIMWMWAQHSGAKLAEKAGNPQMAARWRERADALAELLKARAWSTTTHAWQEYLESPGTDVPYPNFLAVLSGLARPEEYEGIRRNLTNHPATGTPYMNGFALMALARVGAADLVPQRIRDYWGGMLERGATTFWEDFKVGEADAHAMYGRPFGRSLCHAWSSGPAAILPAEILGIRPLKDGWKEFAVTLRLGDLAWASASVPTPAGNIEVEAGQNKTIVKIPAGLTLVKDGERYAGPATVEMEPAGDCLCD
ncbi:MAG: alpha-L-rhamnosidase C-terminal domain-containing protein [Chthoniobacteraceae bacterium]